VQLSGRVSGVRWQPGPLLRLARLTSLLLRLVTAFFVPYNLTGHSNMEHVLAPDLNTLTGRLDPDAEKLLNNIRASGFPGWSAMPIDQGRAAILELKAFAGEPESVSRIEEIRIPQLDSGEIAAGLYVPEADVRPPLVVYMHGGGWVLGNKTSVDTLVRSLANRSGCAVLSVNYRLAPENKFPAALEDVHRSIQWVQGNAATYGLNGGSLAVGGDSSGANLPIATSLLCRDRGGPKLAFQLLVYPPLDHNYHTSSYTRFGDGVLSALSREDLVWFHSHYINNPEDLDSPYVSPLRASSFQDLPPTLIICAEVDPLLDEGIECATRLKNAGVPVELKVYPGMFHGFWRMAGILAQARDAIDLAGVRLRTIMHSSA
jgi:acetyl esterase